MNAVLPCWYFLPLWKSKSVRRIDRNILFSRLEKNRNIWGPNRTPRYNGVELLEIHKTGTVAVKPEWIKQELVKCRHADLFKVQYRKYRLGNHTAENNVRRPCEINFTGTFCMPIRYTRDGRSEHFLWQVTLVRCGKKCNSPPPHPSGSCSACPQLQEVPLIQKCESFMSVTTTSTGKSAP